MSKPDLSVFAPIRDQIAAYLADGEVRSVQEVREALHRPDCHVRRTLVQMAKAGWVKEQMQRRGRHYVVCYRLRRGRGRPPTDPV